MLGLFRLSRKPGRLFWYVEHVRKPGRSTLRERWNIIAKPLPHTREGLRISLPFFILESELDQLIKALSELS